MSCGGRVYKGDTVTISVPFDADDYSNLTITYSTIGDEKIVLTEDEVEIEDGFITHTFQGHDLDLLPDGVIYYTIECDVLGVPNVDSTNTNLYLKTPAGYSGKTAEEIYQEGYEDGLNDCSGSSCNLQSKSVVVTANAQSVTPDQGYDGLNSVSISADSFGDAKYNEGYESGYTHATEVERSYLSGITITKNGYYVKALGGYNRVIVNVPSGETDCSEAFQSGYTEGYNQGQADCPECSGSSCVLVNQVYYLREDWGGTISLYPGVGKDGFASVIIQDNGYGDSKYESGYTAGLEDCSGSTDCSIQGTANRTMTQQEETFYPDEGYDGMGSVYVDGSGLYQSAYTEGYQAGLEDCSGSTPCDCSSAVTESYQSGYTDGYNQGIQACQDLWGGIWCADENWDGQEITLTPADFASTGAGFSSITISDCGYGQSKYNEGFADGQTSCPECDCSSAITEAYNSGYTAGYDSGHTDGYNDGWDDGYDSGYNQGQEDCPECPSCDIETGNSYALTSEFSGRENLYPTTGYAGMESIEVYDDGYGDAKWQEGWGAGYDDGYHAGIMETDCSSAITEAYDDGYNQGYSDGDSSGYTNGFNYGFSSGRTVGRRQGYYQGEQSVIQSFLTGNSVTNYGGIDDYGYVVAYYYTPNGQMCVITGYDKDCDERWDDAFSSMSVDGGPWVSPQLYYYLTEGWHQIRFNVKDPYLHDAFNHNFPIEYVEDPLGNEVIPYMDALKAVSLPEANSNQSGVTAITGTFNMNNGIRILSSSMKSFGVNTGHTANGNALSGATNLNIIISHYQGNENVEITSEVQNGILFYPVGKSSTHSSTLTGWTHMELF